MHPPRSPYPSVVVCEVVEDVVSISRSLCVRAKGMREGGRDGMGSLCQREQRTISPCATISAILARFRKKDSFSSATSGS
eukprot:4932678-Pleurochrysis_carterae.AAC.1